MMYRVIAIVCAGIALAACESNPDWMKTPDWMKMPDWSSASFKSEPVTESVRLESEPPGAEAKASNGQTCRTPCALALPSAGSATVTFTLAGYQPDSEKLDLVAMGDGTSQLRPNPLLVELTPLPPQPKKQETRPKEKDCPPRRQPSLRQPGLRRQRSASSDVGATAAAGARALAGRATALTKPSHRRSRAPSSRAIAAWTPWP